VVPVAAIGIVISRVVAPVAGAGWALVRVGHRPMMRTGVLQAARNCLAGKGSAPGTPRTRRLSASDCAPVVEGLDSVAQEHGLERIQTRHLEAFLLVVPVGHNLEVNRQHRPRRTSNRRESDRLQAVRRRSLPDPQERTPGFPLARRVRRSMRATESVAPARALRGLRDRRDARRGRLVL
jgi:hypothetical protein